MRFLAVDISGLFRTTWEIAQGKEDSKAFQLTVAAVARAREGFDRVVVCCDTGKSFRRRLWPEYKANRVDPGEPYRHQLARTIDQLEADGCSVLKAPPVKIEDDTGEAFYGEADDVIATFVTWAVEGGHFVRIYSADKDLLQCVSDSTDRMNFLGTIMGPDDIIAKLGISASLVPDWLALAGDGSDNFKAFPGIGDKKAVAILKAHGSALAAFTPDALAKIHLIVGDAVAKTLRCDGARERAERCLRVATVLRDLELSFDQLLVEPVIRPVAGAGGPPPGKASAGDLPQAKTESPVAIEVPRQVAAVSHQETTEPKPSVSLVRVGFDPYALEPRSQKGAWWLAEQAVNSRCFGLKYGAPSTAYMAILEGRALGMGAVASLKNAYVVKGNIGWSARCLRGLCIRHPTCAYFRISETTAMAATAVWKRHGQPEESLRITLEEARRRGFIIPPGTNRFGKETDGNKWETDPKPMLVACVEREGARLGWPEIVAGLVTPEELEQGGGTEYAEIVGSEAA